MRNATVLLLATIALAACGAPASTAGASPTPTASSSPSASPSPSPIDPLTAFHQVLEHAAAVGDDAQAFHRSCLNYDKIRCQNWAEDDKKVSAQVLAILATAVPPAADTADLDRLVALTRKGIADDDALIAAIESGDDAAAEKQVTQVRVDGDAAFALLSKMDPNITPP